MVGKKEPNDLTNWYSLVPDSLKTKYHNPCFSDHRISVPFRMLVLGSSGSGKTTCVLELIHRMDDTFGNITICTRNANEPLYNYLRTKIKPEQLQIYEGYENIPDLEMLDPELQHLVIFDDLVLEKRQDKITDYFIRGRKVAKGVSCIYLSQNYWAVPKTTRLQCSYIIMKKLSSTRDLNMILKDFSLGVDRDTLMAMYRFCTTEQKDFLMVDMEVDPKQRFRKNFLDILEPKG